MRTARDLVEQLQLQAWNRMGIPVDQIEIHFTHELRRGLIALSAAHPSIEFSDHRLAEVMAELERTGKTTKYQNPFALTSFRRAWDGLREAMEADKSVRIPPGSLYPLLASAPTGDLNARAVFADDNSMALLLEEDLEVWALCFAHSVVSLLANDKGDRVEIHSDPAHIRTKQVELEMLGQLLLFTATTGTPSFYADDRGSMFPRTMYIPDLRDLTRLARDGFIMFVAAHEFAHVRLDHHEKLRTDKGPFKLPDTYEGTWKKFVKTYAKRFPQVTPEEYVRKVIRQFMEIEADYQGYAHAQATLYRLVRTGQTLGGWRPLSNGFFADQGSQDPFLAYFFSELGMQCFFFSFDFLERAVRTLLYGNDGRDNPLYVRDFDIQDLVLRQTHPSPATRRAFVCRAMECVQKVTSTTMMTTFMDEILQTAWDTIYPRLQCAHASGLRPHRKWTDPSTEMSCTCL